MPAAQQLTGFEFGRDTFSFVNELLWQYQFDPQTGQMTFRCNEPPPTYSHRCFVIVRAARQFFYHARFDALLPQLEPEEYRRLVRQVVRRNVRQRCAESDRILIPGYPGLFPFSQAHAPMLKAECGAAWESYFLRSHWRMVFPVWPSQQAWVAARLEKSLRAGLPPAVHLFLFPRVAINHGLLIYDVQETSAGLVFHAYDPNHAEKPVTLLYHAQRREFEFPPTLYWGGGLVRAIEIYRAWPY